MKIDSDPASSRRGGADHEEEAAEEHHVDVDPRCLVKSAAAALGGARSDHEGRSSSWTWPCFPFQSPTCDTIDAAILKSRCRVQAEKKYRKGKIGSDLSSFVVRGV